MQTTTTAFAWFAILRYAYPREVRWTQVWAAYAACVAMNNVLPANLGTIVMFVMLTTVIVSATFAGMLGGFMVQKIFFVVAGAFVYLYLFLTVPDSFDIDFSWVKEHPWAIVILLVSGAAVIVLMVRHFWPKVVNWWEEAKEGGQILGRPGMFFGRVVLPEFVAWVASLCVVGVFLAAYAIPVTFHSVMTVVGSNSISNTVALTPGRSRCQPGVQHCGPERRHQLADSDRLLARAATGLDSVVDPVRPRPHGLGVRLGWRQEPRTAVVRRSEEEGGGAEGQKGCSAQWPAGCVCVIGGEASPIAHAPSASMSLTLVDALGCDR